MELKNDLALAYLIREPIEKSSKQRVIILLHGVGSNEEDLFGLASQLPADAYIISPRGQFVLDKGRYAWYNVDFSTGRPAINEGQEASSRNLIQLFIKQIKQKYTIEEVYLGGFSQGAIMSYSVGLTHPGEVEGIFALSGRILNEIKPVVQKNIQHQRLKIFVAHGVQDNMLPIHYAKEAKSYLESLDVLLTYHEFETGHQVNLDMITKLNEWLK